MLTRLLTCFCTVLMLAACGQEGAEQGTSYPEIEKRYVGQSLKGLTLRTLEGEEKPISHFTQSKPAVVNLWATWCSPCIKEMPSLMRLAEQGSYKVLAISTDRKPELVPPFVQKHGFEKLPVAIDVGSKGLRAMNLPPMALPMTFIVDETLTVKALEMGEREWDHPAMAKEIKKALAP